MLPFRGCRRAVGGISVFVLSLFGWEQGHLLRVEAVTAAAVPSEPTISDFTSLGTRLRASAAEPDVTELIASPATPAEEVAPDAEERAITPPSAVSFSGASARPPRRSRNVRASRDRFYGATPSGGTWAVLIGVNDYPGDAFDLGAAVNDVNEVDDALGRLGVPGDRRLVLRDRQATAANIRSSLEWLNAHAGPDATAIFFFAGHVQKLSRTTEALVGSDGEAVSDREMASILEGLQARTAWVALAACYSGGFTEVLKSGRILTAAATAEDLAYENAGFGRSYLVEYMVRRAMIDRGIATVEGAFAWATAELRRDHPRRVPLQQDQHRGDLDLRASTRAASSPPQPPASGSPGAPSDDPPPSGEPPREDCAGVAGVVIACS